jgi:hypothetical protein
MPRNIPSKLLGMCSPRPCTLTSLTFEIAERREMRATSGELPNTITDTVTGNEDSTAAGEDSATSSWVCALFILAP